MLRVLATGGRTGRYELALLATFRTSVMRCFRAMDVRSTSVPGISQKEIKQVLDGNKYHYAIGHASYVLQCPFCDREKSQSTEKSMFVNRTTGSVVCRPCGVRGSWVDFQQWVKESKTKRSAKSRLALALSSTVHKVADSRREAKAFWTTTQSWDSAPFDLTQQAKDVFGIQKLLPASLKKYCVHTAMGKFPTPSGQCLEVPCVAFPWFEGEGVKSLVRVKLETVAEPLHRQTALQPKEGVYGLFGWNTIPNEAKELVITAGEFDAVAVHQATSLPAVALPSGTTSLPPEVLPHLEQFECIYLWLGGDVQSRQAATQFAKKLNVDRCYLVRSTEDQGNIPTALTALNRDLDLKAAIASAAPFTHKKILTFQQLREEVYGELSNASEVAGVKWQRFPKLTSILKGHRPGELTVFTGPTGSGKTTLMSELSLDLCKQGVATLWGSFEIKNVRLIKTMLKQFSGLNLENHLVQYNFWADKFQHFPIYFMGFYGPVDIGVVIKTMSHAAYVYDIQHVIIDNLQFMVGAISNLDRYSVQNQAIAEFRKFASLMNVHVSLVIHPRKEEESTELTTASIFGTAKASQEADNVLILQSQGPKQKYLQVTKNRFDGDIGRHPLEFDRDSLTLSGCFKHTLKSSGKYSSDYTPTALRSGPRVRVQRPSFNSEKQKSQDAVSMRQTVRSAASSLERKTQSSKSLDSIAELDHSPLPPGHPLSHTRSQLSNTIVNPSTPTLDLEGSIMSKDAMNTEQWNDSVEDELDEAVGVFSEDTDYTLKTKVS